MTRCVSSLVLVLLLCACGQVEAAQPSDAGTISVPFRFIHNGVVAQAMISGQGPFNVFLDTGADPCVIDLATARQLKLKIDSSGGQGSGTGTDVNLAFGTTLPTVQLGGLHATDVDAVAMNLSKISKSMGVPISGVLDYSLFKGRIVQYDFPRRVVRFLSSNPYSDDHHPANAEVTTLPFQYKNDILADDVMVNGRKMLAHVDTGCSSAFQLTPTGVIAAGLAGTPTTANHSVGFNGGAESREGTIGTVTIGGITVPHPKATFFMKGTGLDHEDWSVRIGNDFMKHYIVTFDFQSMKITFQRP